MQNLKKFAAELIGTFILVFCGCGAAVALGCDGTKGDAAYVGTALAFGLSIVAIAYSVGRVSGGHVNPAVSLAVFINGGINAVELAVYVAGQVVGAFAGAACLMAFVGKDSGLGSNALYNGNVALSFGIEAVLTAIFILAVLGAASSNGSSAGLAIAGALALVHLVGIHFTGTSVNPARSLAPMLLAGKADGLWVFIVAPLVGGAVAGLIWKWLAPKAE